MNISEPMKSESLMEHFKAKIKKNEAREVIKIFTFILFSKFFGNSYQLLVVFSRKFVNVHQFLSGVVVVFVLN